MSAFPVNAGDLRRALQARAMKSPTRGADAGRASSHDTPDLHHSSPASTFNCPQSGFFLPRFALLGSIPCIFGAMPSKPFELPPAAVKALVRDMKRFSEPRPCLSRTRLRATSFTRFWRPKEKSLRLADVKQIFVQIRDQLAFRASFSQVPKLPFGLTAGQNIPKARDEEPMFLSLLPNPPGRF